MKKITVFAVLFTVMSTAAFATELRPSESSSFKMVAKSEVKFEFSYSSLKRGDVCVTIYNEKGYLMSSKTVKNAKLFKRIYDFRKLEPGNYTIMVRNDSGTTKQEIKYKVKEVRLKAYVGKLPDNKAIKLHVGNFNNEKAVSVKIYNQDKRLLHTDVISAKGSFSRVYNLKNISAKSVNVMIENDGETISFIHYLN